jgi:uncharacterized membrane protein YdbT with pleckstrin-like domain
MEDRTIRPSMKSVWAAYAFAAVLFGFLVWVYFAYAEEKPRWLLAIPLIVLWPPIKMHIRRRLITMRLHDAHLTIESGFFSKTRRTVDIAKIQDVTVRQSFGQRLMGVGDLMLESAGESGAMGIQNVDRPREIADVIIAESKRFSPGRF